MSAPYTQAWPCTASHGVDHAPKPLGRLPLIATPTMHSTTSIRQRMVSPVSIFAPIAFLIPCLGCDPGKGTGSLNRGVVVNTLCLERQTWPIVGTTIVGVSASEFDDEFTNKLLVFEQRRFYEFDLCSGTSSTPLAFPLPAPIGASRVRLSAGGDWGVFLKGGGYNDIALLDQSAKIIWRRDGTQWNKAAEGDLDGDGVPEFYIAGVTGLQSILVNGTVRWEHARPPMQIRSLGVVRGDRDRSLVALYGDPRIEWLDARGTISRSQALPEKALAMAVATAPTDAVDDCLVLLEKQNWSNKIRCLDSRGAEKFAHVVDRKFGSLRGLVATQGLNSENGEFYTFVLGHGDSASGSGALLVFDHDGTLVYGERTGRSFALLGGRNSCYEGARDVVVMGDSNPRQLVSFTFCPSH